MIARAAARPLLVGMAAFACAQPGSPPGGQPDNEPPRVVGVVPEAFDTLADLGAPVVIRFDERLSERLEGIADWQEGVLVSPATSPVRVRAGRRSLRISLVEGWQEQQVYRVVVLPVFRDLFNNRRVEPIELVFSTGASIPEAALAGFVTDRITGQVVAGARVHAVRRIDQIPYVALTDTAGFFAMRFMPAGAYDVRAWQDQDRDRAADFFEMQDSTEAVFGVRDTTVLELALLRPDTTPARLARAEPVDSARIRLLFDDFFAPGPVDGTAWLHSLPDSARIAPGTLIHSTRLDSILAEEAAARAAENRGDTAAVDTTPTGEQEGAETDPEGRAARTQPTTPRQPLPSQELIMLLGQPLLPDTTYYVVVQGVTNIQGVTGGGGTAAFRAPPPDTVPADTIPPDTIPPDTVPRLAPPSDTLGTDTIPPTRERP